MSTFVLATNSHPNTQQCNLPQPGILFGFKVVRFMIAHDTTIEICVERSIVIVQS